jgi:hypothetical protein
VVRHLFSAEQVNPQEKAKTKMQTALFTAKEMLYFYQREYSVAN